MVALAELAAWLLLLVAAGAEGAAARRRPAPWPKRHLDQQQQQQHLVQQQHQVLRWPPPPELPEPELGLGGLAPYDRPVGDEEDDAEVEEDRNYDVPQIECPPSNDGSERFACPSPDRHGRYLCIEDVQLCDGYINCPAGEDEDRQSCLFFKTTRAHLDVLSDALLRWARGR